MHNIRNASLQILNDSDVIKHEIADDDCVIEEPVSKRPRTSTVNHNEEETATVKQEFKIKAYLIPNDAEISSESRNKAKEIRRFELTQQDDEENIYDTLVTMIRMTFASLLPINIRLYYVDDEENLIGFSTPLEMKHGYNLTKNSKRNAKDFVFKVYIYIKNENIREPDLETTLLVPAYYVCDNCSNDIPVVGVRFRCLVCLDYDLCGECRQSNIHQSNHRFMKITSKKWNEKTKTPKKKTIPSTITDPTYSPQGNSQPTTSKKPRKRGARRT